MKPQFILLTAAALATPVQAMAEPLCQVLKIAQKAAESDKFMAALKTGPGEMGEWTAKHQIDGFKCVVTTGTTPAMVRGFYNCTWAGPRDGQPIAATLDAIGKCFGVAAKVEPKSYTTTHSFEVRKAPPMWVALNDFPTRPMSFSLIAE